MFHHVGFFSNKQQQQRGCVLSLALGEELTFNFGLGSGGCIVNTGKGKGIRIQFGWIWGGGKQRKFAGEDHDKVERVIENEDDHDDAEILDDHQNFIENDDSDDDDDDEMNASAIGADAIMLIMLLLVVVVKTMWSL